MPPICGILEALAEGRVRVGARVAGGPLASAFGEACYWACWDRGPALLSFAGVTVIAGCYIGGRLAPRLLLALAIGIVVTAVSILIPCLGIALTASGSSRGSSPRCGP